MRALSGQSGPAGVVILKHSEECGLVPNVGYACIVEVVKTADERRGPAEEGDEFSLVVRDEAAWC